jgi:SPP1 gp7 family putative phage head morphogenesis protein
MAAISKKTTVDQPVRPNLGIEAAYRKALQRLIEEMGRSVMYRVKAAYRANEPKMAQDATPAAELQGAIDQLTKQWQKKFKAASPKLAKWFLQKADKRSQAVLRQILRDAGMTVEFKMTPTLRDVAAASVAENVQLIKSIPEKFLGDVQGSVMRSVTAGRDLAGLTRDLQKNFGVTYERAAFIARDQNNKATSAIQRARQIDLGINKGVWLHSHGGKEPRPTHVKNSGKQFDIDEGWFDNDPRVRRRIMPGELINCRCVWKPVIKGFS